MKVRKLAVALALVGGLGSGLANALGLGEVELQSYLNEPLDADIGLRNTGDVDPNDVYVTLAPPEVFERVGVDRNFFLTNLKFQVARSPDGQLVVNITSREAVREPYLNFLIEVNWPSGKLLREYSLLLDPPVYAEEGGTRQNVQPTQTTSAAPTSNQGSRASDQQSANRRQQTGSSNSSGSSGGTFGPTDASDTLWEIALQVRPDSSYSPQQVMLALQDLNPGAFVNGNINRLMKGQVLRIPTASQITSRSNSQAYREVTAQNDALKKPASSVNATDQQTASASDQAPQQSGDELRLLAADESATSAEDGASAGGEDGVAGGAENAGNNVAAMEKLDKAQRENDELNSRVNDLESQIGTLQRLIELKNSQLAEMQNQSGDANETASQEGDPTQSVASGEGTSTETDSDPATASDDPQVADGSQMADGPQSADGSEQADGSQMAEGSQQAEGSPQAEGSDSSGEPSMADEVAGSEDDDQISAGGDGTMGADGESQSSDQPAETDGMVAGDGSSEDGLAASDTGDGESITDTDAMQSSDEENGAQDAQPADGMIAANDSDPQSGSGSGQSPESGAQPDADGPEGTQGSDGTASSTDSAAVSATDQPDTSDQTADAGSPQVADQSDNAQQQQTQPESDKGLLANVIHGLKTNPIYQLIAGAGAVALLVLLGLLARRNANREKEFYAELNRDSHDDSDSFDLDFGSDSDTSPAEQGEEADALAEADAYIAYGRNGKAAEVLEDAISKEPSRSDLRLKLLAVYADSGQRDAFEKQHAELETLDDESAMAEAQTLRARLDDSESTPSIDELESQLRSGSAVEDREDEVHADEEHQAGSADSGYTFGDYRDEQDATVEENLATALDGRSDDTDATNDGDELDDALAELDSVRTDPDNTEALEGETTAPEYAEIEESDDSERNEDAPIEYDLSNLDLDNDDDLPEADAEEKPRDVSDELESMDDISAENDSAIEFELDEEASESHGDSDSDELTEDDFGSLELDDEFAEQADEKATQDSERATSDDEEPALNEEPELATDDSGEFDDSFLDDLDAELDKVAGEEPEETTSDERDNLDELELDVSDEDLALMEEVAETPEAEQPETSDIEGNSVASSAAEDVSADDSDDEQIPELDQPSDELDEALEAWDEPDAVADAETPDKDVRRPEPATELEEFDEAALDDDDDFDFLAGTDEAATKLDLARAYVEMGDADGAKDILEEVAIEGTDDQKSEAQVLLKKLA